MRKPRVRPALLLTASFVVSVAVVMSAGLLEAHPTSASYRSDGYLSSSEELSHWVDTIYAPDPAVDTGTGADGSVQAVAVDADGRSLLVGDFTAFNGTTVGRVVRLNTDGSVDTAFDTGSGANDTVRALVVDADGRIILGGDFTAFNGTTVGRVVRLNPDGSIDATFDTGIGASSTVHGAAVDADGRIVIVGAFAAFKGTSAANKVVRLDQDGSIDNDFTANTGTGAPGGVILDVAVGVDGTILLAGTFTTFNRTAVGNTVRLQPDGRTDTTFDTGTGSDSTVRTIAIDPDGMVVLGGDFTTFDGTESASLVLLHPSGAVHTRFIGSGDNSTRTVALDADGNIFFGGVRADGTGRFALLNRDGRADTSLTTGAGADGSVNSAALDADGALLLGGDFTTFNGESHSRVVRLTLQVVPH
ncbi:hypothetical protein [Leifsonia poae]|uniref:Delta-60 repeat domain-containing protein n=1 Tax=Leifsonia poae TaxID=110933 RepID=A0A9W6H795_9MICO|nr:hypothetical protein [Leifsonia poae]GLJ74905.1 hypothetical protein GCM10017584_04780 [Leifsonia poae]